jgi:two-component system, LuxR family, sensor kinase FixL
MADRPVTSTPGNEAALVRLLQVVAVAANEADSVEDALRTAVRAVCAHTGWAVGHAYTLDPEGNLESTGIWTAPDRPEFDRFREVSEARPFRPGTGMIGVLLATGEAQWSEDVTLDEVFVRQDAARAAGLHAAFAFPVLSGRQVVGALEFYASERLAPDTGLLEVMVHVGSQLGRVIERERAQDALRASESRRKALFDNTFSLIGLLDADGITLDANKSSLDFAGAHPDDVIGRPFWETPWWTNSPDSAAKLRAGIQESARGRFVRFEAEHRGHDGEVITVDFSLTPVRGEDGRVEFLIPEGRDISDRKRMEEALRLSEAKFAGIMSIASDAIVMVDESQRIIFYNQGAETVFLHPAHEVIGEPLGMLIPDRYRPGHDNHVRDFGEQPVQARRMGERGQIQGLRKNGEVFPADASISKLDIGGRRIYTAVLRDVSDRVRAEQALERQAEELARSNAELEQFAYVASHDLQEPLRKIRAFGERLEAKYMASLGEQGRDYLARMGSAAERMQMLIDDLLTFSRVTTKAQPFERVDLEQVAREVISDLEIRIEQSGGGVQLDALPTIEADPMQMRQLLQNLIGNSLKYRQEDTPPRVRISARISSDRHGTHRWVELAVADNGIGFDEKYLDRVFGLFQRLHSRSHYEGTGMGLAICRKIAERHGGSVTARSRPGEGATFLVTLPFTQSRRPSLRSIG